MFWGAGGGSWVSEKTRKMKIDNDMKELQVRAKERELGVPPESNN